MQDDIIVEVVPCTQNSISHIIGPGGETIQRLQADTNTRIEIIAGPKVSISGASAEGVAAASRQVAAIVENQANPDYEGAEGKALRAKATEFASARSIKMKEADALFASGDQKGGHALLMEAKGLGEAMRQANVDAARAILAHNNAQNGDQVIDLHGLRAEEAVDAVKARLNHLATNASTTVSLEIIVGAGLHTKVGHSVALMPAVEKHLKEGNYSFTHKGAATLVVSLVDDLVTRSEKSGGEITQSSSTEVASPTPHPAIVEADTRQSPSPPRTDATNEPNAASSAAAPVAPKPAAAPAKSTSSCCTIM